MARMAGILSLLVLVLAKAALATAEDDSAPCPNTDLACAAEAGLSVEAAGNPGEALHMLQRRGTRQTQEPQDQGGNVPLGDKAPNRARINWDSSKHGEGPIWSFWRGVKAKCKGVAITKMCRKALANMATSIFRMLQKKEGHTYTEEESHLFRRRYSKSLKENTTLALRVVQSIDVYDKWKEAVFHMYELMRPAVTKRFVDDINKEGLGWEAVYRESMAAESVENVIRMTGLQLSDTEAAELLQDTKYTEKEDLLELSKSSQSYGDFDARYRWPECGSILRHVRYQDCQNCWSHATALVAESRICIASHGRLNGRDAWLSQSFIAMCRADRADYCKGGSGSMGFVTVNMFGVPTGAPNRRGNAQQGIRTCVPQVAPNLNGLRCPGACTDHSYPRNLESDLFYPRFNPRSLSPRGRQTLEMAKQSILQEGPILFGMQVYADFWAYVNGVYRPSHSPSNRNMGGHAVTGMGFGPGYFLCINSWGTAWGIGGAFKAVPEALDLVVVLPGLVYDSSYPTPVP